MNPEDRAAFLTAILNEPTDDTVRGVYADALRESDDPFDRLHGRFIWSGLALSMYRGMEPVGDGMFMDAIAEQAATARQVINVQARHLLGTGPSEWAWDNYPDAPDRVTARVIPPAIEGEVKRDRQARRRNPVPVPTITWERGCVTAVGLTLAKWLEVAATVLACCPLECVEVIDVPGLTLRVMHEGGRWRLGGTLALPVMRMQGVNTGEQISLPVAMLDGVWPTDSRVPSYWTRDDLVAGAGPATQWLVYGLRERAAGRWPTPVAQDDVLGDLYAHPGPG